MRPSILLLPLLIACEGGVLVEDTGDGDTADTASEDSDDTGTDTDSGDTDTDTNGSCSATLSWQSPRDDEQNVSVTKVVTVRFSAAVAASDWALAVTGVTGTATLASNGLSATFTPSADLATDTDYALQITVCGDTTTTQFRTASGPVGASTLEGRSYAVAYDDVTWVEPAGISSVLGFLGQPFEYVLLNVEDIDETYETITASVSPGVTDNTAVVQDPCTAPTAFDPADFAGNPVIEIGPADLTFDAAGTPVTVQGAYFKSVFIENGDAIGDIDISGQIDVASLGMGALPCSFVTCTACYNNPSVTSCANVRLTADRADWIDGLVYDPALDPTLNSACN